MKAIIRAVLAAAIACFMVLATGEAVDHQIGSADAHLIRIQPDLPPTSTQLQRRLARQTENLKHALYVCRHGGGTHQRWGCWAASSRIVPKTGQGWLREERRETMNLLRPPTSPTIARMIAAAEAVASRGGNPWPNCPDPYDGSGASWQDTKECESPSWTWFEDPPGHFCGPLQLDPDWWGTIIRKYGVPCDG